MSLGQAKAGQNIKLLNRFPSWRSQGPSQGDAKQQPLF